MPWIFACNRFCVVPRAPTRDVNLWRSRPHWCQVKNVKTPKLKDSLSFRQASEHFLCCSAGVQHRPQNRAAEKGGNGKGYSQLLASMLPLCTARLATILSHKCSIPSLLKDDQIAHDNRLPTTIACQCTVCSCCNIVLSSWSPCRCRCPLFAYPHLNLLNRRRWSPGSKRERSQISHSSEHVNNLRLRICK